MLVGNGTPRKPEQRAEAQRLRREEGMPIKKIAAKLGVSTSSVSYWVRGIEIAPEHEQCNWEAHQGSEAQKRRNEKWSRMCRDRREAAQEEGRRKGGEGDWLHAAGCMLYWAEGRKDRNQLCLVNSDVEMLQFFVRFLRETFELPDDRFSIRLNAYLGNGLSIEKIEEHWLEALRLPRGALRKHTINHYPTSSSGMRANKLPYGTCTVKVTRSTEIVQHIFGAIQEYAGFEEPRWLG